MENAATWMDSNHIPCMLRPDDLREKERDRYTLMISFYSLASVTLQLFL